jgi:hypothetical protein
LELLGETFPRKATSYHTMTAFLRCRQLLYGKSDNDVLSLPIMQENTKLTALRLIVVIAFFANSVRKECVPLLAVRIITLTMRYGMNDMCKFFLSFQRNLFFRQNLTNCDSFHASHAQAAPVLRPCHLFTVRR